MRQRVFPFITVLFLVILSFSFVQAGSRHPGARPPIGPPPEVARPHHATHAPRDVTSSTAVDTHHHSDIWPEPFDPPIPMSSSGKVHKSSVSAPGSKPAVVNTAPSPPHHLIGDPPTWGGYMGTFLFSTVYAGDSRLPQPGEVRVYTGPYQFSTSPGGGTTVWGQWVINWNPHSGLVREVFYYTIHANDPSNVYWYLYPTQANQNNAASSFALTYDAHISLSQAYSPLTGPIYPVGGPLSGTQGGDLAIGPLTAGYSIPQTPANNFSLGYLSDSGYLGFYGNGQNPALSSFSPDDFTDDSEPLISSTPLAEGLFNAKPRTSDTSASDSPSAPGASSSIPEYGQATDPSPGYASGNAGPRPAGGVQLAATSSFSPDDFVDDAESLAPYSNTASIRASAMANDAQGTGSTDGFVMQSMNQLATRLTDSEGSPALTASPSSDITGLPPGSVSSRFVDLLSADGPSAGGVFNLTPQSSGTLPSGTTEVARLSSPSWPGYGQASEVPSVGSPVQGVSATEESAASGSEDQTVVQAGSASESQGSGSALPLGALAGLILGAGAWVGARRLTSSDQTPTASSIPSGEESTLTGSSGMVFGGSAPLSGDAGTSYGGATLASTGAASPALGYALGPASIPSPPSAGTFVPVEGTGSAAPSGVALIDAVPGLGDGLPAAVGPGISGAAEVSTPAAVDGGLRIEGVLSAPAEPMESAELESENPVDTQAGSTSETRSSGSTGLQELLAGLILLIVDLVAVLTRKSSDQGQVASSVPEKEYGPAPDPVATVSYVAPSEGPYAPSGVPLFVGVPEDISGSGSGTDGSGGVLPLIDPGAGLGDAVNLNLGTDVSGTPNEILYAPGGVPLFIGVPEDMSSSGSGTGGSGGVLPLMYSTAGFGVSGISSEVFTGGDPYYVYSGGPDVAGEDGSAGRDIWGPQGNSCTPPDSGLPYTSGGPDVAGEDGSAGKDQWGGRTTRGAPWIRRITRIRRTTRVHRTTQAVPTWPERTVRLGETSGVDRATRVSRIQGHRRGRMILSNSLKTQLKRLWLVWDLARTSIFLQTLIARWLSIWQALRETGVTNPPARVRTSQMCCAIRKWTVFHFQPE